MEVVGKRGAVGFALLALAYLIPYTVFYEASNWALYVFWLVLGVAALLLAWTAWGGGDGGA